jgi:hypothetical protein
MISQIRKYRQRYLFMFLAVFVLQVFCGNLYAYWEELIEATRTVARGPGAPGFDEALRKTFRYNDIVNDMGLDGTIDNHTYQQNQQQFQKLNDHFSRQAARDAGLSLTKQTKTSSGYKPGTDTDNLVGRGKSGRDVTLADIQKARNSYNSRVERFLGTEDIRKGTDWAKKTDTDFMPKTDSTKEFTKINRWINKKGGTAYESPAAADLEARMRNAQVNNQPFKVSVSEATKYQWEMDRQISHKTHQAARYEKALEYLQKRGPAPPGSTRELLIKRFKAEYQKTNHQIAKYLTRKNAMTNAVAESYGVKGGYKPGANVSAAANTRGPQTKGQAFQVGKNASKLKWQANADFAKVCAQAGYKNLQAFKQQASAFLQTQKARATSYLGNKATQAGDYLRNKYSGTKAWQYGQAAKSFGGKILRAPDAALRKLGLTNTNTGRAGKALGIGGKILMGFQYYDVAKEAYKTGDWKGGMKKAAWMTGQNLVMGYVGVKLMAVAPITMTLIGTYQVSYGLTREVMKRVSINGKSLDVYTQEAIDDQLFLSSQYDVAAQAELKRLYLEALKKGHKLSPGMTSAADGWQKILQNMKKGGKIFAGVFANSPPVNYPGQPGSIRKTTVENSTIINTVEGKAIATDKAFINTGIQARGAAEIKDSTIINTVKGEFTAQGKDTEINAGISADGSQIKDGSNIISKTTGKVRAFGGSKVNTGIQVDGSMIKNSTLRSETNADITAKNGSKVNAGIQAKGSTIEDSTISSKTDGKIEADGKSNVNRGVQAGNSDIKNSTIINLVTGGKTNAKKKSKVNEGVKFEKSDNDD